MAEKEVKELIIIAGVAQNNVIGHKNQLPWHIKEDLQRFKSLTLGHPVIMGRSTYESITQMLGKPLPGRTSIVVTRQSNYQTFPETIVTNSINDAINKAHELSDKAFIIGGQEVYDQTLPLATKLEITHIHKNFEGDAFFPMINRQIWKETKKEQKQTPEISYSFITYEKPEQKRGLFIVFEGIDGCGKSTQIRKLTQHIFEKDKHNHVILTRNPYKDTSIRKTLREDDDPYSKAEQLADLYISDRKKQTDELILPALKNSHIVLSDRYKLSTISYQAVQGIDPQILIDKQAHLPVPDMTFIIDAPAKIAKERMLNEDVKIRGKEHKFEADINFLEKIRQMLLRTQQLLPNEKIFIIDGNRPKDVIFQDIQNIFDKEYESYKNN